MSERAFMEDWQIDFDWLRVRHYVKEAMGKKDLPDLQAILFLIGIQELGHWNPDQKFTKEEKQDLMHIAVCSLLEEDGYYEFTGRDHDGWPHFVEKEGFDIKGLKGQSEYLKKKIISYFNKLDNYRKNN